MTSIGPYTLERPSAYAEESAAGSRQAHAIGSSGDLLGLQKEHRKAKCRLDERAVARWPRAEAYRKVADTGSRTPRRNEKRAAKTAVGCLEEVSPDSGSG